MPALGVVHAIYDDERGEGRGRGGEGREDGDTVDVSIPRRTVQVMPDGGGEG